MTLLRLAVALLLVAGCKESAKKRAETAATASDFWPAAPTPTSKTGTRTFRYNPESVKGYVLTATGGTPKGSPAELEYSFSLELSFGPSATPRGRDSKIKKLELSMTGVQDMTMKLDAQELVITEKQEPPVRMKRDDGGSVDVGGMTDKPFTTIVFTEANRIEVQTIADHPFLALRGAGDMLDNGLILFPDLPTEAIAPGHTWTVTRNTPVGSTGARTDVTYDFVYLGDGPCPSGAASCAQLTFTASSTEMDIPMEAGRVKGTYGFAGKVFFDTVLGTIDESRVHMNLDVRTAGVALTLSGTFALRPTSS